MENKQPRIPAMMTLRLTRPTTTTTDTQTNRERTPLLQTTGQAPHPHRYGRDGTHQTETRRTPLPTPTTHTQVTKNATAATHTTTIAPTTTQRHSQTHTPMTTHTVTLSGPRQCPKCNGLVRGTKYPQHIQTCTQTNTDTQHPSQIVTHPPTVTQTTRTTTTHTTTHPPTNKLTPHTTTHPTSTPTPRHTLPPASPPLWTRTRLTRPQTTEDRILQTFANMDTRTEPTQTRQTDKKHIGPPPEIIAIIANLQATSTLDDELRAERDRYMTRRAHQRTNTDQTEASTSTRQPHITHQTAPHKTHPSNTPDTDTDTDSTTSTAETVIHIETTHTTTQQTQTTDDDTDNNTDTTSLTDTDEHTQTPQPTTHTTRDSRRYKKRKTIRKQKKEQNRKH
ncbi:salivary glue protein Sgs-3-like [Neodiprion pinetum]|uniref:salivary glue protein Sgs-3-like n=1 Tax=Neodiprion pinetum TaxID=441929 RepID=UPI0037203FFD